MANGHEATRWGSPQHEIDMVGFVPGRDDIRIERGGWVFYVRAVPRDRRLDRDPSSGGGPTFGAGFGIEALVAALVVVPVVMAAKKVRALRLRREGWRVGVVRKGAASTWNDPEGRVLHEEHLPRTTDPRPRVAELAARVDAGDFDPAAP